MAAYKGQFEALSNRLKGFLDTHKLSYFHNGLKYEIHPPIKMLCLISLSVAFDLAKIQEDYLTSSTKKIVKRMSEKGNSHISNSQWTSHHEGSSRG